jgi:hypothetical protein
MYIDNFSIISSLAVYGSAAKPEMPLSGKPRLNLAIDSGSDLSHTAGSTHSKG